MGMRGCTLPALYGQVSQSQVRTPASSLEAPSDFILSPWARLFPFARPQSLFFYKRREFGWKLFTLLKASSLPSAGEERDPERVNDLPKVTQLTPPACLNLLCLVCIPSRKVFIGLTLPGAMAPGAPESPTWYLAHVNKP